MMVLMFDIAAEQKECLKNVHMLQVGRTWYFSHSLSPASCVCNDSQSSVTNLPLHSLLNKEKEVVL